MLAVQRLIRRDLVELININEHVESNAIIDAKSDFEAVQSWLARFTNENTIRVYTRDITRFLSWLIFSKGKHLNQLLLEDFNDYVCFLQNPSPTWCVKAKNLHRYDARWRPFAKPLSKASIMAAISVLQSLFSFLEDSNYINKNPVKLLRSQNIIGNLQAQKYKVLARMLEDDEWLAVQNVLQELPAINQEQKKYKARANLLFSLLYLLGLRIEEASLSVWSNFRKIDGKWWCFIVGKGAKLGHVPVSEALLQTMHNYRAIYNIDPDIEMDDNFIFVNDRGANLTARTLYNCVKDIGKLASGKFGDKIKKEKLLALSPHWLRHLSASHQDKRGVPMTMIRDNHRHASINTTQIYMHSEDLARHNIMQEHSIAIESVNTEHTLQHFLSIKLSKGPLDKQSAVNLIRRTIDANILQNAQLIEEEDLAFKYKISALLSDAAIADIKMLCKIWMFEPIIEQVTV